MNPIHGTDVRDISLEDSSLLEKKICSMKDLWNKMILIDMFILTQRSVEKTNSSNVQEIEWALDEL